MELLAPAGDLNKLKYAFAYGAQAVYCGVPDFSLRGGRVNKFTRADVKKGIKYAHALKKKVYVTLNIYPHNQKFDQFKRYLPRVIELGPDAIIASDPGIIAQIRKKYPRQAIHLSTQANALNYGAIEFWKKQGISRVILARETTLKQAARIKQRVPNIELEYFCHGAMCLAYSGRCLLSAWFNSRSANQGECSQPCRWPWKEKARRKRSLYLEEDENGTYIFNSKDLCLIEYLDQLEKTKINGLKIEGRNKSLYYITTVVKYYAQALKARGKARKKIQIKALKEFSKLGNRQYTTGFAFGADPRIQNFSCSRNQSRYKMVGELIKVQDKKNNLFEVRVHNAIKSGSFIQALSPDNQKKVKVEKIFNHKKISQKSAHGGTDKMWYIKFNKPLDQWTIFQSRG
ncbi:MAG: U32 family peptidase [Patescibacteria group bacterium]|nr:U32 family peptidase [Patescibacteria group bacterium]